MKKMLFSIFILAFVLSGCDLGNYSARISGNNSNMGSPQQNAGNKTDSMNAADQAESLLPPLTVLDIKQKYDSPKQTTLMPLYNVEHDKKFKFRFNCNMTDLFFYENVVTVHTDQRALPESKIGTFNYLEDYNADKSVLVVEPSFAVLTSEETGRDFETSWGYAPIYYLRVNYDLDASERTELEKPIIIPFTIKSELQAPHVRYEIDADGRFKLVWDEVKGAEKYNVYNVYSSGNKEPLPGPEQGYKHAFPGRVGTVTNTEFQDFYLDGNDGLQYGQYQGKLGQKAITAQNFIVNGQYYVTAVKDGAESNFGPPVDAMELSNSLPTFLVNNEIYYMDYKTAKDLPKTTKVYTIDETVLTRSILYDPEHIEEKESYVLIPFKVEGTLLSGKAMVSSLDKKDLEVLRQGNTVNDNPQSSKEGFIQIESFSAHGPGPEVPTIIRNSFFRSKIDEDELIDAQRRNTKQVVEKGNQESVPQTDPANPVPVHADSAVEEYLALHLMAASQKISLKAFPETQNFEVLYDTVDKVIYQNPLILDVKSYGYDYRSLTLHINYSDSKSNIKKKQEEIIAEATRLVKWIIKDGASEDDKRKAIYDYLNDHTRYDDAALANVEQYGFKKFDARFNDSFNTYGILVKKIGVCASYASAYKLLSDLAGLESIVITGTLDNVPHTWNKVKINNEWLNVDPTNNETNSGIPYWLFDSNDETAQDMQFVINDKYWIDYDMKQFAGKTNSHDYYISHGLQMDSMEQFHDKLTESIQQGNPKLFVRFDDPIDEPAMLDTLIEVYSGFPPDIHENAVYTIYDNYLIVSH